eukprot:CAMPEP_0204557568 /NCGR_PEP_ID=MMETSP0661-20131031/30424_1 /ASSEMBLY_ACC=CAM_ASM_000606 /TAXON_ID=109239 /ORGANISM="Alexandrium margalefi, Strain AMGDE01CS-322" /LENGTH=60 /DNA_ID=CAMNT_0051564701 /DNA_START=144 /DNA_END=323 /DNA_ORIENTATION=-
MPWGKLPTNPIDAIMDVVEGLHERFATDYVRLDAVARFVMPACGVTSGEFADCIAGCCRI